MTQSEKVDYLSRYTRIMKCSWPECSRAAVVGAYCFNHHDLLVYSGAIEDRELDQLLVRVVERAKVEVASRYPNNPDLRG